MNNEQVFTIARKNEISLQEIANVLNLDLRQFNRVLQRELCPEDSQALIGIITNIAEGKGIHIG